MCGFYTLVRFEVGVYLRSGLGHAGIANIHPLYLLLSFLTTSVALLFVLTALLTMLQ